MLERANLSRRMAAAALMSLLLLTVACPEVKEVTTTYSQNPDGTKNASIGFVLIPDEGGCGVSYWVVEVKEDTKCPTGSVYDQKLNRYEQVLLDPSNSICQQIDAKKPPPPGMKNCCYIIAKSGGNSRYQGVAVSEFCWTVSDTFAVFDTVLNVQTGENIRAFGWFASLDDTLAPAVFLYEGGYHFVLPIPALTRLGVGVLLLLLIGVSTWLLRRKRVWSAP